tara:strand:+ start:2766 stop:2966 length:201 start_codon:yes stop_codon:yes gene_type:complete
MNISLNGEKFSVDNNTSLTKLLELNNINEKNIVIEINKTIITKDLWEEIKLNKNDKIEIITAVGGG